MLGLNLVVASSSVLCNSPFCDCVHFILPLYVFGLFPVVLPE